MKFCKIASIWSITPKDNLIKTFNLISKGNRILKIRWSILSPKWDCNSKMIGSYWQWPWDNINMKIPSYRLWWPHSLLIFMTWIHKPWKMVFILKQSPCLYIYTILLCPVLKVIPEQVSMSSLSLQTPATWWQWWCSGCPSTTVPQQAGQPAGHRQQVTHGNIVRAFMGLGYNIKALCQCSPVCAQQAMSHQNVENYHKVCCV